LRVSERLAWAGFLARERGRRFFLCRRGGTEQLIGKLIDSQAIRKAWKWPEIREMTFSNRQCQGV
jgi:hypothetical protein